MLHDKNIQLNNEVVKRGWSKLQRSKWSQTALFFDDLTFFLVGADTPICFPDLISKCLILSA